MTRAMFTKELPIRDDVKNISFGNLFILKKFRVHGGGKGSLGIILGIDNGKVWDKHLRPLVVAFEDCPNARYRLSPSDIEIISRTKIPI